MRIDRIELDGFGRFHERSWELDPGLNVFLGENEAGKTTFLNAVRALLFGFEATREGRTWYPAFAGGRRGGRLVLATDAGERWVIERHGERGGTGALVVRAPGGGIGGQETLDRLLRGADRDLFNNVFAFGLGELQDFRTLSAAAVKGRIYGAGAGLGGASAVDLERELRDELKGTFVPSGSKPPLNALLARAETLRGEIADLARQPEEHAAAHLERTELAARAEQLRAEARAARERASRLGSVVRAGAPSAALTLVEAELAAGDATLDELPDDAVPVLERREGLVAQARSVLDALDEQLDAARRSRAALDDDRPLLEVADELLALRDERTLRSSAAARRRELEAEAARHAADLETQRAHVGGWEVDRLLALDDSIASIDATRAAEREMAEARAAHAGAEQRARAAADDLAAREREVTGSTPAVDELERQAAALRELESAGRDRAPLAPSARWVVPLLIGLVVGLVALVVGLAVDQPLLGAAAALALGAAAAFLARRSSPAAGEVAGAPDGRRLRDAAGLAPDADDRAIAARRDEIATLRARAALARDHAAALAARREDVRRREAELQSARERLDRATAAWSAWLEARGLPADLTPDGARQVLTVATAARKTVADRDRVDARLAALDREAAAYHERACTLLTGLGMPAPADLAATDASVAGLIDALERARMNEERARELDATIGGLVVKRASASEALLEAQRAVDDHVAAMGCPDPDAVRRRGAAAQGRRALQARARELRAELAGIAGNLDGVESLLAEAANADHAALVAGERDAAEQAERLEAAEREAFGRIGALEARIRELEAAEEIGMRRQELAIVEGQAAAMARRWAVGALTLRLLGETRARYERERQPDVIRAAETHFERITGGRYARIIAPPGEDAVRVETEGGLARTTEELSRGTAEQLYLALRFGLIEEFATHAEPLPVVMDDILVNFDPQRVQRAAAAVNELATRHQVLYFTCHPSTARLLDPQGDRTVELEAAATIG